MENTTLVAMRALTADGRIIYRAGAGRDLNDTNRGRLGTLGERGQGSVSLEGRWDRNARWVVRAGALRPGGRFLKTLEEAEFPARLTSFKAGQTLMAYTDGVTRHIQPG